MTTLDITALPAHNIIVFCKKTFIKCTIQVLHSYMYNAQAKQLLLVHKTNMYKGATLCKMLTKVC